MSNQKIQKLQGDQILFPINSYKGITLPILEMADPYYPYSHLATSVFSGYYILFFMYSIYFIVVYPLLNYLHGEQLYGMALIQVIKTNLIWDFISALLFIFLAMIFIQVSQIRVAGKLIAKIIIVVTTFLGSAFYILNSYELYFTDRIFIIVLNIALCIKVVSYLQDKSQSRNKKPEWASLEIQHEMGSLKKKILFLISPCVVYHKFVKNYDPALPVHYRYLMIKLLVSFLCLMVNNIVMVKFIAPIQNENLSFVTLLFKLFPVTFYFNISLYFMVMDNVLAALAEITKMKIRVYYLDWWNAETIDEFLDKWCLLISQFSDNYLQRVINGRKRHCVHTGFLLLLLFWVFGKNLNAMSIGIFLMIEIGIFLFGGIKKIQNNYIVHLFTLGFTPLLMTLEMKYKIFDDV